MNPTFLEYVAKDLIAKYGDNLARVAVVFPNKRAALFMNDSLAKEAGRPIWSPAYLTISDLFKRQSNLDVADPIKQVCDLYHTFVEVTGTEETLDHFYGWGQLLLADFDDIDKNMADAHRVFANLKDLHALDTADYLTEEQREELRRFFKHFNDDLETELKRRFLTLWCHFEDLYVRFRQRLRNQGLAYEGMLYRDVAERKDKVFERDVYVFVGFNKLLKAEQQLFEELKQLGKARFYWDFDHSYLQHEAGQAIQSYLSRFPNELPIENEAIYGMFDQPKQLSFISATTEHAQARFVTQWLREGTRMADGRHTAIVLCDEQLLQPVLHGLPEEVGAVNVTTGYPLAQAPIAALVDLLLQLQTKGHIAGSDRYRVRYVKRVLTHPYLPWLSAAYKELLEELQAHQCYYPTRKQMAKDEELALLFADTESGTMALNRQLVQWMLAVLKRLGRKAQKNEDPFFQESLFRMYTLLNRLDGLMASGDLEVDLITLERLLRQLIASTQIPFHGEPAEGLQVMGVLETRNLDFDHLLLLSCNEGNMPKGVNDASFIPYAIRKAYGLTTVDHKVSIYAYYFHRLLQRAKDVTVLYNCSTEDGHTGEMSRFMLQLMVERQHAIDRRFLRLGQTVGDNRPMPVKKDEKVWQQLMQLERLSPTALNNYLYCPLMFYFNVVRGIKRPEESDEMIDNRLFGNIFHRSAELLYLRLTAKGKKITEEQIKEMLRHQEVLESVVDESFREELFHLSGTALAPQYDGLQLISRGVVLSYLRQLLETDLLLTPFTVKGLEQAVQTTVTFPTPRGERSIKLFGIIDRLDEVGNGTEGPLIRVIDYKTNKPATQKVYEVGELFTGEAAREKHTDYYLQTLLYALIVSHDAKLNPTQLPVAPGLLFIQQSADKDYDPILSFGKEKILRATDHETAFRDGLTNLLSEIFHPDVAFMPTANRRRCETCIYQQLCKQTGKKS